MPDTREPHPQSDEQPPAQDLGGLFNLSAEAEVIRGDQHEKKPEEPR